MKMTMVLITVLFTAGCGLVDDITGNDDNSPAGSEKRGACYMEFDNEALVHDVDGNQVGVDLPGGGVLSGETSKDAAERETGEELQLDVQAGVLLATADHTDIYDCSVSGLDIGDIGEDLDTVDLMDQTEVEASSWPLGEIKAFVLTKL